MFWITLCDFIYATDE